jgi:hypothetical protein
MDMKYYWLTDRVRQKQFDVYWRPGRKNLGDYHTKHHSAQHQKDMRVLILHQANSLRFCEGVLNYAGSRNPSCARTHTHRQIKAPVEPLNLGVCSRVCALSQYRT